MLWIFFRLLLGDKNEDDLLWKLKLSDYFSWEHKNYLNSVFSISFTLSKGLTSGVFIFFVRYCETKVRKAPNGSQSWGGNGNGNGNRTDKVAGWYLKVFYYRLSLLFMAHACVFEYFGLAFVFMCVSLFENFSI